MATVVVIHRCFAFLSLGFVGLRGKVRGSGSAGGVAGMM